YYNLERNTHEAECLLSKLNYPLYPPWDWAEKSEGFFSPNLRCITSGVVDGGSGRQICKSPFHWEYMK
ncbi:hypothetical protein PL684_18535, partial [Phocaeicola vulgatus]|nr:hypothetical protein [Phocaeicola vulgatus]